MIRSRVLLWSGAVLSGLLGALGIPEAAVDRSVIHESVETPGVNELEGTEVPAHPPEGSPFRVSRANTTQPFSASGLELAQALPVEPQALAEQPPWILSGVILGEEPMALIDGLPGGDGSTQVLAIGDRAGDGLLVGISAESVTIEFPDTIWTFHLARPWR